MSISTPTTASSKLPSALPRVRYDFLDGIRGLAALFVVIHHAWQAAFATGRTAPLPAWFRLASIFQFGHEAVGVFIVLSGFCLMLPVARTADCTLPKGFGDFIRRRSRRILPPYFAALAISLAAVYALPFLRDVHLAEYSMYDRSSMPGAIVSHLVLLNNLRPNWAFRIDPPLWSVATEWQIYFLFAILLLPIWRRTGAVGPIAIGVLAAFLPNRWGLGQACFWFIGLFGMGMAAASYATRRLNDVTALGVAKQRVLAISVWLVAVVLVAVNYHKFGDRLTPFSDMAIGVATSVMIVICAARSSDTQTSRYTLQAILSAPALRVLGAFSYSLYLIHYPLVWTLFHLVSRFDLTVSTSFLAFLVIGLPITLVVAYVFHILFERRFMNTPLVGLERQKTSDVIAQVTEPAI